jgi:hypothetical protein
MVADQRQAMSGLEPDIAKMNPAAKGAAAENEQRRDEREPPRAAPHR